MSLKQRHSWPLTCIKTALKPKQAKRHKVQLGEKGRAKPHVMGSFEANIGDSQEAQLGRMGHAKLFIMASFEASIDQIASFIAVLAGCVGIVGRNTGKPFPNLVWTLKGACAQGCSAE